jgi:AcrR family transcriptional regulator
MPGIARAAGVSEATAYRYFPDLLSIMQEGFVDVWPGADEILPGLDACADPVERVAIATEFLARNVLQIEGAVRTMIALTIARSDAAGVRPGHRLGLIEAALVPMTDKECSRLRQLKNDLSVVISAEALFTLLDLKKLTPDAAVASLTETAKNLVRGAVWELGSKY